jgi:hypothetical protein
VIYKHLKHIFKVGEIIRSLQLFVKLEKSADEFGRSGHIVNLITMNTVLCNKTTLHS